MVKVIAFLGVLLFISGCEKIEVYKTSQDGKAVAFQKGEVQCVECTMPLETKKHTAQAIMPNGRVYFFDDPGCMAKWIVKVKLKDVKLWIYTDDTKRYIDARKAWYKLGEKTPMNYGFGAYEKRIADSIGFEEFIVKMKQGENLTNPALAKRYLHR